MGQMLAPMIQQMTPSGTSIPFTPASSSSQPVTTSTSSTSSSAPQCPKFPVTELISFDQAVKVEGISKKLDEINSSQADGSKLVDSELKVVLGIVKGLVRLSDENFEILIKILRWKKSEIFPLLDVLRLKLAKNSFENQNQVEKVVTIFCENLSLDHEVNAMLSTRGLCNLMNNTKWGHLMDSSSINHVVALLPTSHQNLEIAVTTFIYNSSVKLLQNKDLDTSILIASSLVLQVVPVLTQKESEYRSLEALGNIIQTGSEEVNQFLLSLDTREILGNLKLKDERSAGCVKEIMKLLKTDSTSGLDLD